MYKEDNNRQSWDEEQYRQDSWIDRFCWCVIILAVLYFAPILVNILTR